MTKDDLKIENLNLRALVKRLHKELKTPKDYEVMQEVRQSSIDLELKLGIERYEL
jgi:hypothetical protein